MFRLNGGDSKEEVLPMFLNYILAVLVAAALLSILVIMADRERGFGGAEE